jgi:NADPH:quinone reductase-like Zn-dependent oxidoreductase
MQRTTVEFDKGKCVTYAPTSGNIVGCDFAGKVVALGSGVSADKFNFKIGDRVAGLVHGCE